MDIIYHSCFLIPLTALSLWNLVLYFKKGDQSGCEATPAPHILCLSHPKFGWHCHFLPILAALTESIIRYSSQLKKEKHSSFAPVYGQHSWTTCPGQVSWLKWTSFPRLEPLRQLLTTGHRGADGSKCGQKPKTRSASLTSDSQTQSSRGRKFCKISWLPDSFSQHGNKKLPGPRCDSTTSLLIIRSSTAPFTRSAQYQFVLSFVSKDIQGHARNYLPNIDTWSRAPFASLSYQCPSLWLSCEYFYNHAAMSDES